MAEVKNSTVLEIIFEHARALHKDDAVTVETFIVAVIDFLGDPEMRKKFKAETEKLERLVRKLGDPSSIRASMLRYINSSARIPTGENMYMKKKIFEARMNLLESGIGELTPEAILELVISDPQNVMGKHMDISSSESEQEGGGVLCTKTRPSSETVIGSTKTVTKEDEKESDDQFSKLCEELTAAEKSDKEEPKEDAKEKIAEITEYIKGVQNQLSEIVFGQDNAVNVFASGLFQAKLLALTDKKRVRPCATYLFAGPPGVGKTFLAESAAKILDLPFMRFDMSEYSNHESAIEFCGSDGVYKNSKSGNFTEFVSQNPKSIVLFDEIEKAHIQIIHLFLQILDAGRIRDSKTDTEISLKDVIMIFTTNAGKQLYSESENGDFSAISRKVILKALQKDVNPETNVPYFPAAICSRFASGNVVMFNHISANNLSNIAKREVLRHAKNFEREIGVEIDIDEKVYTAILLAEGGTADARTVRSRSESFFDGELFELFRLIGSDAVKSEVKDVERIKISVDISDASDEVASLFESKEGTDILVFSSEKTAETCKANSSGCNIHRAGNIDEAEAILKNNEIGVILLDLNYGAKTDNGYLNIEDVDSESRDFFRYAREFFVDTPIYLLQTDAYVFDSEERVSFMRQGVRGIVELGEGFSQKMGDICEDLHRHKSMSSLAKANKIVTYETSQKLTADGKEAEITLFDFNLAVAMDAEDSENILSNVSKPNVRFDQVIGADEAKKELKYFVEYLKNPKKYLGTGVRAPKGVLLYGPPGTGKTMLAKAMASESDVTFITAEGNQFIKKYVGEGAEKVHELFRTARKYAPSILFVDEIDAIAKERTGEDRQGTEEILTAFLTEMDGFKNDTSKPVFVLAATNFDVEPGHSKSLDPAMMRRFDRRVYIDLPNRDDRIRYMKMKIASNPAFNISDKKLDNLAIRSTGMSLAQLESVFELSLRTAIREGNLSVTDEILDEAFETFNSGEKKNWDISQLERVARHEAGHAFLCWKGGETPSYMTVVARGDHGGYMQHSDNEGKAIYTRSELRDRIRTALGGRAAEIVYYGPENGISTGASGDLASATRIAQHIICTYGMDDDFGLAVIDEQSARFGDISSVIRQAVNKILSAEMQEAVRLIEENKAALDALVDTIMIKNHLSGTEISEIFEKNTK